VQCDRGAIIRLQAAWRHSLACAGEAACRPAVACGVLQTTTDANEQNNTDPLHYLPLIVTVYVSFISKGHVLDSHLQSSFLEHSDRVVSPQKLLISKEDFYDIRSAKFASYVSQKNRTYRTDFWLWWLCPSRAVRSDLGRFPHVLGTCSPRPPSAWELGTRWRPDRPGAWAVPISPSSCSSSRRRSHCRHTAAARQWPHRTSRRTTNLPIHFLGKEFRKLVLRFSTVTARIRYDTTRYGRLTCAQKVKGWPA